MNCGWIINQLTDTPTMMNAAPSNGKTGISQEGEYIWPVFERRRKSIRPKYITLILLVFICYLWFPVPCVFSIPTSRDYQRHTYWFGISDRSVAAARSESNVHPVVLIFELSLKEIIIAQIYRMDIIFKHMPIFPWKLNYKGIGQVSKEMMHQKFHG